MKTNDKMRISLPESRKMHSWDFNFSKFLGEHVPRPPKVLLGLQPSTNLGICLLYTSCPEKFMKTLQLICQIFSESFWR